MLGIISPTEVTVPVVKVRQLPSPRKNLVLSAVSVPRFATGICPLPQARVMAGVTVGFATETVRGVAVEVADTDVTEPGAAPPPGTNHAPVLLKKALTGGVPTIPRGCTPRTGLPKLIAVDRGAVTLTPMTGVVAGVNVRVPVGL
jgi:hypothetical protein